MSRVTIKDIAQELNISIGTVSKALSGKNGISEEMRNNIMTTAKSMGYHVNRVAQSLSRKGIRIGVVMPEVWQEYYGSFKKGIQRYLKEMMDFNLTAEYRFVSNLYSSGEYIDALMYFMQARMDGVILCPSYDSSYCSYLEVLNNNNIPLVILGSDLSCENRLACVREDSFLAGKMAAEVMGWIVPKEKSIAVFIGNKDMSDHREKVNGFIEESEKAFNKVCGIYETQDDPEVAYHITKKIINERPELAGIYVATGNSVSVCKCIEDHRMEKEINIIATDIFPEIESYVNNGIIKGLIFQDPEQQGRLAIKTLYRHLVFKDSCDSNILIRPQLIIKNNFDVYIDRTAAVLLKKDVI